jgi:hypothetical protein
MVAAERDLLARVSRHAHANGWAPGPYPGQWRDAHTEVIWSAGTGEVGVARKHRNTWMAHDWYPATTVSGVVAVLVAEGVLPPAFHAAYAGANLAGVAA